jgi:AcrR family transcriptional regulator
VNYHFGSKDELLADLFVSRTTVLNRERFAELKAAELEGNGRPSVEAILRALESTIALVSQPGSATLRRCAFHDTRFGRNRSADQKDCRS